MSLNYNFPFDNEKFLKLIQAAMAAQIKSMDTAGFAEAIEKAIGSNPHLMEAFKNPILPDVSSFSEDVSRALARYYSDSIPSIVSNIDWTRMIASIDSIKIDISLDDDEEEEEEDYSEDDEESPEKS